LKLGSNFISCRSRIYKCRVLWERKKWATLH